MNTYNYRIDKINYLAIFMLLNIFNYSIFRYNYIGIPLDQFIVSIIEPIRPILSIFFLVFILKSLKIKSKYILFVNLLAVYTIGGLISVFITGNIQAISYSLWSLASGLSVLTATKDQVRIAVLFALYFIVGCLVLGLPNGLNPFFIAFSSKTYWPALLIVLIVILYYIKAIDRRILTYLTIISFLFIALSGKRTALLIVCMFLIVHNKKVFWVLFTLLVLVTLQENINIFGSMFTFQRFQLLSYESGKIVESNSSSSWADRQWITGSYLQLLKTNPMGVGIGQAANAHSMVYSNLRLEGYSPHNSYLAAFVEAGILGGGAYLILTLKVILNNIINKEKILIILVVCVQMYLEYNSSPGQILYLPYLILLRTLW